MNLAIAKVPGFENPADLVTKYLNSEAVQRHLDKLHITRSCGRDASAPVLAAVSLGVDGSADKWQQERPGGEVVRHHAQGR